MAINVRPFCGLINKPLTSFNSRTRTNPGRRSLVRRRRPICRASKEIGEAKPLQPNEKFSKKDIQRICQQGPSIDDLKQQHDIFVENNDGEKTKSNVEYIPTETLGDVNYDAEPAWSDLPKMSFMEFFQGIRERNWTSEYFNEQATPWNIKFFMDSGRLFRPVFNGYRALVTMEDGSKCWVDMSNPGARSYLEDLAMPRVVGDVEMSPRVLEKGGPGDYGYNQVFEQIHLAYEQRVPTHVLREYVSSGWVDAEEDYAYDCPGERLLDVSFHLTPQEPSLHKFWDILPSVLFVSFAFSFLGVCLALGIFKPRKQMPTDPMQAMEFAQSKGRARKDGRTDVRFDQVAGLESIIDDLKEIVEFLKDPEKFKELGAKPPKGVLLEGPPGTGKTLIAKAIAGEAEVPFYQMSGSEFVEAIVGVGAARIRDLFKRARAQDGACIIFVDEIDALGIKRADAGIQTNEEREQTLNQLLTEMDGFTSETGVVFVGATNRADLLDPALTRAGRFDRKVRVLRPDTAARYEILQVHAKKHRLSPEVDLEQLARDLPGLSGAELENVLNEAALAAVRRDGSDIIPHDVYEAVDRVLQGIRHPIRPTQLEIGRVFAIHEIGRAIVATVLRQKTGRLEAVERISMVARGKDWSRTIFFRGKDEDYTLTTRGRILERIRVILAGRVAEELVFGDATTYATRDISAAFKLAEKVVASYGFSSLGITTYAAVHAKSKFMQKSFEVHVDNIDEDLFGKGIMGGMFQPSNPTLHKIKMEAYGIMWEAYSDCLETLSCHSDALEAGATALLEKEELLGKDLDNIMKKHPPRQAVVERAGRRWAGVGHTTNGNGGSAHPPESSQAVELNKDHIVERVVTGKTDK